ncbi:hypothetical protein [Kitasatospora sp. MY 5-36]|uniref:hypothetical protein n=1 Tax=Kitasatospora sp. MY 5-36 TaxID=1678027 RepID=UPI000670CE41|nr:hypothetical protein [Kitasatospora sp. MY 5-36]
MKAAGPNGFTGDEVYRLFKRRNAAYRSDLTARLCELPGFAAVQVPGDGRHRTVYLFAPPG